MSDDFAKNKAAVANLISTISAIQKPILDFAKRHQEQWQAAAATATKAATAFMDAARSASSYFNEQLVPLLRHHAKLKKIEDAGWLPHYTSPVSSIPDDVDVDISQLMERHYTENWVDIKAKLLDSVRACDLDQEAKDTFSEAVNAHEQGLFRSTCRVLFPEIERVVRAELLDGKVMGIASVKELQKVAGQLGLSELKPHGLSGMSLYLRLVDHMYIHIDTLDHVVRFAEDGVPNRHAAMHGLVSYRSFRNSINMLIMADFMFQVVSATKANRQSGCIDYQER